MLTTNLLAISDGEFLERQTSAMQQAFEKWKAEGFSQFHAAMLYHWARNAWSFALGERERVIQVPTRPFGGGDDFERLMWEHGYVHSRFLSLSAEMEATAKRQQWSQEKMEARDRLSEELLLNGDPDFVGQQPTGILPTGK